MHSTERPANPAPPAAAPTRPYLLERVDDAAIVQLYADGFAALPLDQKRLIWHLYEAALAGRDIYVDQRYRHNLVMRDVLEAQAALLSAQNALFSAIRSYRVRELELQKELGLLEVTIDGVWREPDMQALGVWGEF